MPCPGVTYEDMDAFACGEVSSRQFDECLPHAVALVRGLTFPNEPTGAQEGAFARAVCAAVLADVRGGMDHGAGGSGGFTIGSFSVSGGDGGTRAAMEGAARAQLVGSGLLYMGLGAL